MKDGAGGDVEERKRVLRHASTLNRADVISKVVRSPLSAPQAGESGHRGVHDAIDGDSCVDKDILNHVDEQGLTALHHAVRKSSIDAIRVLLRLGVDVTAKGSPQSSFPGLTAYQVAVSGVDGGKADEMKQVFLTEAVQAVARGDADRLRDFLNCGVDASAEYGTDEGEATRSLTLAEWARQLGRSDIIPDQSAAEPQADPRGQVAADLATMGGVDPSGNDGTGEHGDRDDQASLEVEVDEGGDHDGQQQESGATPHSEEMFVEELRGAIVALTAECEQLEGILWQRGTMGIIQRARAARQEVTVAEREVETSKSQCNKWKAEEEAAVSENARLQEMVVKAQAAIDGFKAGGVGAAEAFDDGARAAESGRERSHGGMTPWEGGEGRPIAQQIPPSEGMEPASDPLTNGTVVRVDAGAGAGDARDGEGSEKTEALAEGQPRETGDGRKGATVFLDDGVAKSRRKEEAIALSSHLQVIAMHLEEEVQMMREMQSGEGAGGVVRRIRSLRAEAENNKEEARQAHSVARYLEARVIVLASRGDELRSQLEKLEGLMRSLHGMARAEQVGAAGAAFESCGSNSHAKLRGPGKEDADIMPPDIGAEYDGPELDASLGSEDEGGGAGVESIEAAGSQAHGGDTGTIENHGQGQGGSVLEGAAGETAGDDASAGRLPAGDAASSQREAEPPVVEGMTSEVARQVPRTLPSGRVAPTQEDRDASAEESKNQEEGKTAAPRTDSGVDAAKKARRSERPRVGRKDVQKVTVFQEVLSSMFGWEVAVAKPKTPAAPKQRRREGSSVPQSTSVLFA